MKLLIGKDSMEGIFVSEIVQIKFICKIERCIIIQPCVYFLSKHWDQLYNLPDAGQRNDITYMSDTIGQYRVDVSISSVGMGTTTEPSSFCMVAPDILKKSL